MVELSESEVVAHAELSIDLLLKRVSELPERTKWQIMDAETFRAIGDAEAATVLPNAVAQQAWLNRWGGHYWRDQYNMAYGYYKMVLLRADELVRPALRMLNAREVIGPAVLSRAALEVAALFARNVETVAEVFMAAAQLDGSGGQLRVIDPGNGQEVSVETFLVRAIWGTRNERLVLDPRDYVVQINAMNPIQRFSKRAIAELGETYDFLSGVAHPNAEGYQRFWANVRTEGPFREISLEKAAEGEMSSFIRMASVWALGWASATIQNYSSHLVREATAVRIRWFPDE